MGGGSWFLEYYFLDGLFLEFQHHVADYLGDLALACHYSFGVLQQFYCKILLGDH